MRKFFGLMVVSMALVVVGCGATSSSVQDAGMPTEDVSGSIDRFFGFHDVTAEGPLYRLLARQETLVARCMEDAGFDYQPVRPAIDQPVAHSERLRTSGYGLTTSAGAHSAESATADAAPAGSIGDGGGFSDALDGRSDHPGCRSVGESRVFGPYYQLMNELVPEMQVLIKSIETDERFITSRQQWSNCMSGAGYDFDSPDTAILALSKELDASRRGDPAARTTEDIRDAELATARVDASCGGGEMRELADDLRAAGEAHLVRQHLGQFRDVRRAFDSVLRTVPSPKFATTKQGDSRER